MFCTYDQTFKVDITVYVITAKSGNYLT